MKTITLRRVWIERMDQAGKDREACWKGFYEACRELSDVGSRSKKFNPNERKAAIALELVASLEGEQTKVMKDEFMRQYKVLGAPGDFGYGTNEGRAMQAVYEWWTKLGQSNKPQTDSR